MSSQGKLPTELEAMLAMATKANSPFDTFSVQIGKIKTIWCCVCVFVFFSIL